jgi:peptidoglycan/xylan/chitin deacetylase (PgdA/CDA1 family)
MGLKNTIAKIIFFSGLPFLIRELIQRHYVTILVLHDPEAGSAGEIISWLNKKYNVIDLNDFLSACEQGSSKCLPPKSLIITFDDGHIGNHQLLPFLKKTKIPITIFLCSGIVNTNRHFWFKFPSLPAPSDSFKQIADEERLRLLAESGFLQEKEYPRPQALNKEQVLEMREFVNFQSHTVFHPCLNQCTSDKSWFEINKSKSALETELGLKINAIAFPNGDYSKREVDFALKAGYSCALTIDHGYNTIHSDKLKLKRICLNDSDNIEMAAVKASGIWGLLKRKKLH